jgi:hypothetical protein
VAALAHYLATLELLELEELSRRPWCTTCASGSQDCLEGTWASFVVCACACAKSCPTVEGAQGWHDSKLPQLFSKAAACMQLPVCTSVCCCACSICDVTHNRSAGPPGLPRLSGSKPTPSLTLSDATFAATMRLRLGQSGLPCDAALVTPAYAVSQSTPAPAPLSKACSCSAMTALSTFFATPPGAAGAVRHPSTSRTSSRCAALPWEPLGTDRTASHEHARGSILCVLDIRMCVLDARGASYCAATATLRAPPSSPPKHITATPAQLDPLLFGGTWAPCVAALHFLADLGKRAAADVGGSSS